MRIYKYKKSWLLVAVIGLGLTACTKNFESYNTDNTGLSEEQLKADFNYIGLWYSQIQSYVIPPSAGSYQLAQNLNADCYVGYMMSPNPFAGGVNNLNYFMMSGWNGEAFSQAFTNVMAPVNEVARRGARTSASNFWDVALILKVAAMDRVTDVYGPIPYLSYGQGGTSSAYDSQKDVYTQFFKELDTAMNGLKEYIATGTDATPFSKFDILYGGDMRQWLKLANSLRLRLAMHIVKVDPATAKTQGEIALDPANGGYLTANEDNAVVNSGLQNPLYIITQSWTDICMGASIDAYMNGYKDPRIGKYFDKSTDTSFPAQYKGIRIGAKIGSKGDYTTYSTLNFKDGTKTFKQYTSQLIMNAAEVYFLRAEAALRGWSNTGGSASDLYSQGVAISFSQWGVSDDSYLTDVTRVPAAYKDPKSSANNGSPLSTLVPKWDDGATNEVKLERIITQKWLAIYPNGQEAWTDFRRTGYPKLYPVVNNNSGGLISTSVQIRRLPFPQTEYATNAAEVAKAVTLLGGADNGGTRLWWDTGGSNF